jgi:hypothetical protein
MKKLIPIIALAIFLTSCADVTGRKANTSALDEQDHTEQNQRNLNTIQPPPTISWSLERDNLIKRFKLQNDRAVSFFMYVFIEGVATPIGYYQVNKVSSVNSQLTNPEQIVTYTSPVHADGYGQHVISSPAEDGSYGTNGEGVFGFTPENIYIESNMKYIVSTVPLNFKTPVNKLAIISSDEAQKILDVSKKAMGLN